MGRTVTIVLVLLATLQIARQASIANDDNQNLNERINKLFTFNSESRDVLNSDYHNTVDDNQEVSSEHKNVVYFQLDHSFLRSKRQIEQGTNSNDDFSLDEPDAISPEKTMEVTAIDDDLANDSHSEQEDKAWWDEDSDENDKNQLMETENEKGKQEHQASIANDVTESPQSEKKDSSLPIDQTSITSDRDSDSLLEADEQVDSYIGESKIVKVKKGVNVTDADEDDVNHNISTNDKANPNIQEKDNDVLNGDEKAIQADDPTDLGHNEGESDSSNHSKETTDNGEINLHDNKLSVENDGDDTFLNVDSVDDVDDAHDDNIDEDDVDTFLPLKPQTAHSPLAHLKQLDDGNDYQEGSGDDSGETNETDEERTESNTDPHESFNASSETDTGSIINIDDDSYEDDDDYEEENIKGKTGGEILISSTVETNSYEIAKESTPFPIETSTMIVDPSVTYDPLKVRDPLGIDNITNIMEFGLDKVFGNIDIDSSGSGDGEHADSLETDGVFKVSTEREESTTLMAIDEPLMNKTRLHQVNIAQIKKGSDDDSTVLIPPLNNSPSEANKPINEIGINKGEKEPVSSTEEESNSSSTGSFIVLGAIMVTIVVLLGYSVVKSQRQKRKVQRRQPPTDNGTELKEIDPFLPGKNGHGPGGKLNAEVDKLLSPNTDDEKNGFRGDGLPVYRNGIQPDNGNAGVHTPNAFNGDLSEIKVEDPQKSPQEAVNNTHDLNPDDVATLKPVIASTNASVPVTNGYSPTDPLGNNTHGHQPDEKDSPKVDDRGSWVYGNQPEAAKIKMFIDHDSIPKTPVLIVKRGSSDVDM